MPIQEILQDIDTLVQGGLVGKTIVSATHDSPGKKYVVTLENGVKIPFYDDDVMAQLQQAS